MLSNIIDKIESYPKLLNYLSLPENNIWFFFIESVTGNQLECNERVPIISYLIINKSHIFKIFKLSKVKQS